MSSRIGPDELQAAEVSPTNGGAKRHRQKLFAVLPTLLTLGNLACGFGAITFAAKVGPTAAYNNELLIASMLIFAAMLFDIFDGSAARLMNQTSEFGAQLDSLCDAVSFGVAPAFVMLQFTKNQSATELGLSQLGFHVEPMFLYSPRFLWVVAMVFVVCVVLRLARFNVETDDDDDHSRFSGLPSPAGAGVLAAVPIAMAGLRDLAEEKLLFGFGRELAELIFPVAKIGMPLVAIAIACLMVSRVPYPHFFNQLLSGRRGRKHLIQLLFVVVLIFLAHEAVLFFIFAYFAFAAPLAMMFRSVTGRGSTPEGEST